MFQDCSIQLNASTALGFQDKDKGAILVSAWDINKEPIYFGGDTSNVVSPGMFPLSETIVQVSIIIIMIYYMSNQ